MLKKKQKAEVSGERFTDIHADFVKPRDAEVKAAAEEDRHCGHLRAMCAFSCCWMEQRVRSWLISKQEVSSEEKWAHCWISRNLQTKWLSRNRKCVSSHSLTLSHPRTHTHKHVCDQLHLNPSRNHSLLAPCDVVTFFSPQGGCWGLESPAGNPRHPSFPLPFIPWWGNCHLGGRWAWLEAWTRAIPRLPSVCPKPPPAPLLVSDWSALANATLPLMPEQSMISSSPFTSHHNTDTKALSYQSAPAPFIYIVWIITTVTRFKEHNRWSAYLTCNWLSTLVNHLTTSRMMIRISQNEKIRIITTF